ncbi:retroviral-like aspartic protease family protein [Phenylobacterium sp.]|uniref:retroviral-like aspartic protease family protein n=1 Tax=Phenylobacterium sp. TaxID=1871053 RepID=UPI00289B291B|nr:retroviral-like aspartic protease family protein [Phenylobacterium sp.]
MLVGSQTRRLALGRLAAAGGLLLTPQIAFGQVPESPAPEPDDTPTTIAITRQLFEHITAPVTINGQGPWRFMVDTGANVSCVSVDLAAKLALPKGREVQVNTIVGRRARPSVVLERLEIGTRVRRHVEAPVLPMSSFDIDGVLGIDWLKGQRLVMGFAGNTLEITRSRHENSGKGRVVVPARRKSGQLTIVDADISGRSISAMIDSGSQFSLGNASLRKLIMRLDPAAHQRSSPVGLISIAGERFSGEQLYLPFIRLGGLNLGNVPVVFSDMPIFKLWDLHDTPTIMIGIDLLTQFETVSVDFGRSAVRFDIASA